MFEYTQAPITWALVRGMAQRAGFDAPRAVLDGWLSRAELGRLVDMCQKADCAKGCMDVLATPSKTTAAPPQFCAIKAELEALAPDVTAS